MQSAIVSARGPWHKARRNWLTRDLGIADARGLRWSNGRLTRLGRLGHIGDSMPSRRRRHPHSARQAASGRAGPRDQARRAARAGRGAAGATSGQARQRNRCWLTAWRDSPLMSGMSPCDRPSSCSSPPLPRWRDSPGPTHRWVMHGPGWFLHREPPPGAHRLVRAQRPLCR